MFSQPRTHIATTKSFQSTSKVLPGRAMAAARFELASEKMFAASCGSVFPPPVGMFNTTCLPSKMRLLLPCLKISRICHQSIVLYSWCGRREAGNGLPSWISALNFAAISLAMMGSAIFRNMTNANLYCGVTPLKQMQYVKVCLIFVSHCVITWEKQSSYYSIKRMCGGAIMGKRASKCL